MRRKGKRRVYPRRPPLAIRQILAWADEFHERTGRWPKKTSGRIFGGIGERWNAVDKALRNGGRGLPYRSSLPRLLAERRGVRNIHDLPRLSVKQILAWADAHQARTGKWPNEYSGPIPNTPGETWAGVNRSLWVGVRGLAGESSLARLLAEHRGVRNPRGLPRLTLTRILDWADQFHKRTGRWPTRSSGRIATEIDEKWNAVDTALREGLRGLVGGSSLTRLLAERRGVRNPHDLPRLSVAQVLAWADAHRRRTGQWQDDKPAVCGLQVGGYV